MVLQENNLRNIVLNLPGSTLRKKITCTMLAHSPQSSQCCLNTSETTLYGATNYLCNVGSERTVIFLQEDNLYNFALICLGHHCTITCAILAHSPQTTFHSKMIYNFVCICLGHQHCTRKLSVRCCPMPDRQCV